MSLKKNSKKTPSQIAGSIEGARQPLGTGSVTTPATPQKATGYQWDMLKKAKGSAEVKKVQEWAEANGFSPTGQFMTAIKGRLGEG